MKASSSKVIPLAALALVGGLLACGSDFDPASRVSTLRVLAVGADQPYAHPGESVHLDALAADPAGRPITYGWAYCVNPTQSTPQGCFEQYLTDRAQGKGPAFTIGLDVTKFQVDVPADFLSTLPSSARTNAMIGVITVACPGTLTAVPSNGLPYTCTDPSGRVLGVHDVIGGMKRIFVRSKDRNQNPVISKVTWDGVDWPATETKTVSACDVDTNTYDDCDAEKHDVAVVASSESVESGVDEFGSGFEEQVVVQYYADEGLFKDSVRITSKPENGFVARKSSRGKTLTLWLVLRDDRGGVTWTTRKVTVR